MTTDRNSEDILSSFSEIISILEKNLKYIDSLGMGEETLRDYRKVILYLKGRSKEDIEIILGKQTSKKKSPKEAEPQISDEELASLTAEQVKAELLSSKWTRSLLERLASVRFGVTKGALSSLRSRDALIDKLLTLLAHEGTHESISRVVGYETSDPLD